MADPPRQAVHYWMVVAGYAALSVWCTWPLAARLGTSLPGDYGDPAFVAAIMTWVGNHLTAVCGGDTGAWAAMWDLPIFAPEHGTLAYSEHFLAQSIQALPVLWATKNPLAGYNVVYLVTMAATAVAAHGLALRLTGRHLAGVVAGLTCTFNEYRWFWAVGHLHALSLHWWLFALLGLDVFAATRSRVALAAATLCLVALNYSSIYLLAYSAPFTAAFAVWSLARHGRLRDVRAWAGVVGAGLVATAAVLPVLLRYFALREALPFSRSVEETAANSATVAAYLGAWPWLAPLALLALAGLVAPAGTGRLSLPAAWGLGVFAAAAIGLSLGPVVRFGADTYAGPYLLLRDYVPGFDGLRMPHRFVGIAAAWLAILAGVGAAWIARWRVGLAGVALTVALVTRAAWLSPFPLDVSLASAPLAQPPAYLRPARLSPPIYQAVAGTGADSVLAELPFGTLGYEVRYTFFTAAHGRRLLNGYSGVLPAGYLARRSALEAPLANPESAWKALSPATHVVVHTGAWPDDTGQRVRLWLEGRGARVVVTSDGAWLYALPPD